MVSNCSVIKGLHSRSRILGTKFFPRKSGKFPVRGIWKHPLPSPDSVPPIQDWPLPVPSQSWKWNRFSRIWNFVFKFPKFQKFSTAREFSCRILKILIQNKTKQDQGKNLLHSIVFFNTTRTKTIFLTIKSSQHQEQLLTGVSKYLSYSNHHYNFFTLNKIGNKQGWLNW